MSLLVVGSVALDSVKTPFGEIKEGLGGSATYFSIAAGCFTKVRLVAVVGEDFPAKHVSFLKSHGVDLRGLSRATGKTFRWKPRRRWSSGTATSLPSTRTGSPRITGLAGASTP